MLSDVAKAVPPVQIVSLLSVEQPCLVSDCVVSATKAEHFASGHARANLVPVIMSGSGEPPRGEAAERGNACKPTDCLWGDVRTAR
jgi:hypothetical protein